MLQAIQEANLTKLYSSIMNTFNINEMRKCEICDATAWRRWYLLKLHHLMYSLSVFSVALVEREREIALNWTVDMVYICHTYTNVESSIAMHLHFDVSTKLYAIGDGKSLLMFWCFAECLSSHCCLINCFRVCVCLWILYFSGKPYCLVWMLC